MKWWPRNVGDYLGQTMGLSMLEDCAYSRLLDIAYATEAPLPQSSMQLHMICRCNDDAERAAVDKVVKRYFVQLHDGYHHTRVDAEIEKSRKISAERSLAAQRKWDKDRDAKAYALAMQMQCQPQPQDSPTDVGVEVPLLGVRKKAAKQKSRERSNGVIPPTNAAWDAYAAAYLDRYGAEPPRGPQVNGALANLLRNIPAEDLPAVATWYVRSNDPHVAREKHPITLLARSWQRWHTEWKTKGRQTATLSVVGQRTAENLRRWLENGEEGEKGEENHGTG